jgi:hypothetical protein
MRFVIAAAAIAALSLTACGKKPENDKPTVTASAGGYTVKSGDGSATIATGAAAVATAAGGLPDFAPLYPGAQVQSTAAGLGNDEAKGGMVVFTTSDSPDQVMAFYKTKAQANGMAAQLDANMGAARQFAASDEASGRGLQVIVSGETGATQVQLIWAKNKG